MILDTVKVYWREIRVALIIAGIAGIWYCVNDYMDTKHRLQAAIAENSTLQSEFKKIGDSYQTQNKLFEDRQQKQQEAIDALGKDTVNYMRASQAQLQSLYTAVGIINSNVASLKGTIGGSRDGKGVVTGVTAVQDRNGLPPLTSLSINYDPNKPLDQAFSNSQWLNNKEMFNLSLGEWQLKDGGYRATMRLNRDIYDQKTGKKIGSEEVPLSQATASFDPKKFQRDSSDSPRFTFTFGATRYEPTRKWYPMGILDYRFTKHWGISAGTVNQGAALGLSYRFDIK